MSRLPSLLRGRQLAHAVWFDPSLVLDIRVRVLALWASGAELRACDDGLLLKLATPTRLDVGTAPGLVLIENGGLTCVDRAAPVGSILLLRGGTIRTFVVAELPPVNPANWLDVSGFSVARVEPLGPPAAPAPAPAGFDVRVALRRPPTSVEAEAARVALGALAARGTSSTFARWFARLGTGILSVFGGGSAGMGAGGPIGPPHNAPPAPPHPPGWLQRMARRIAAPLWGPLLGGAHGRYLGKLFDLFDSGKLEDALRHAIPLGGEGGWDLGRSWSLPGPRANLGLRHYGAGGSSTIGLESSIYQQLRQLYERALTRLLAEDRLDDAVFVLVELLREYGRAVELLEGRGKFALAAELAELGELAPEIAVRLWMRADNPKRAVTVARRKGAFAAGVDALMRDHPVLATQLRSSWARHLADRGDVAGACEVAWAEPSLRAGAVPWLDVALAQGGPAGARLIPYLLRGTPGQFTAAKARVDALLEPEGWEAANLRSALATGLAAVDSHEARTLLRPVFRRLIADQAALPLLVQRSLLTTIRDKLDEPALAADLPASIAASGRLDERETPLLVAFPIGDVGTTPVHDIVFLDNGGLLVALGELGARLYSRDGRVRAEFHEPVHQLIPVTSGGMAIGVYWGNAKVRLSRFYLITGTASRWHDAAYAAVAPTCDGNLWFVAEGESIIALDALAGGARTLWRVNRVGGPVEQIDVSETAMTALVGGKNPERWVHSLPTMRLSERRTTAKRTPGTEEFLSASGELHAVGEPRRTGDDVVLPWITFGATELAAASHMLALPRRCDRMQILDIATAKVASGTGVVRTALLFGDHGHHVRMWCEDRPILDVALHDSTRRRVPTLRVTPTTLSLCDASGRAIVFELTTGQLLRNLRV